MRKAIPPSEEYVRLESIDLVPSQPDQAEEWLLVLPFDEIRHVARFDEDWYYKQLHLPQTS